jgi:hypothetical protein
MKDLSPMPAPPKDIDVAYTRAKLYSGTANPSAMQLAEMQVRYEASRRAQIESAFVAGWYAHKRFAELMSGSSSAGEGQ